ncbi:MAG: lipopolysaccharide transport periplasmic protein LptA [Burkholderiales bacterium]|jgi:lipopolysaccharide export system protein LptA|nr:lipopolysaccharide transport periplasmic protein LptA [Burkholderiales bacterium]
MIRPFVYFALVSALFAALSFPANAERADRNKPIHFSADKSEAINYDTKVATLAGNVIITQGTMVIHADRVTFRQNPNNSISATAYGNPVSFRQKRDNVDEFIEAFAKRVEYNGEKEVLELFDQAFLKRENDEIKSDYIVYHGTTETFRAAARPESGNGTADNAGSSRVTGQFEIKPKNTQEPPPSVDLKEDASLKEHNKSTKKKP